LGRLGNSGILGLLLLGAGCRPAPREARTEVAGRAPFGIPFADTRRVLHLCPSCGTAFAGPQGRCEGTTPDGKPCGLALRHGAKAPCGFCGAGGDCAVCRIFESGGRCRHCLGSGRLDADPCFNCSGSGRCAACGGSAVCDACGGSRELTLPWTPRPPPSPAASPPARDPVARPMPALAAPGDTVRWSGAGEWTLFRIDGERRIEVDRVIGDPAQTVPRRGGFYRAISAAGAAVFDVLDLALPPGRRPEDGDPVLVVDPPLRTYAARWSREAGGEAVVIVDVPGLPSRRVVPPVLQEIRSLRVSPSVSPARAGVSVRLTAEAEPPLDPQSLVHWRIRGAGRSETLNGRGPATEIAFEEPGVYRLEAVVGGTSSPPVDLPVYRVRLVDREGRPVSEARPGSVRNGDFADGRLRDGVVDAAPERLRVQVEDPLPGAPASVRVLTRSPDEGLVQGPVDYALTGPAERRTTRPILLLPDRDDAGRDEAAAEDDALHVVTRGRVEVQYRGLAAGGAPVGPLIAREIPLRFIVTGPGFPPEEALLRAIDARVAQANAVWEPLGRRFRRDSLRRFESPRHLLLVRGRAAGTDLEGRPSRAGMLVDGRECAVSTPWRGEAGSSAATARALQARIGELGSGHRAELFAGLFGGDAGAVLLRVTRADGAPAVLEPLPEPGDAAQSARPLTSDLSDGCEVAASSGRLSLEEAAVVAGGRAGVAAGLDLFVVSDLRALAERPAFKVHPAGAGPAPALAGSALLAWSILDGSDRHPYALARALGELLLPGGTVPGAEDTLFSDPLSESSGVTANKRVGPALARRFLEGGGAASSPD
jgi:hypothetical protein